MLHPASAEAPRHGQRGFLMVILPVLLLAILTLGF